VLGLLFEQGVPLRRENRLIGRNEGGLNKTKQVKHLAWMSAGYAQPYQQKLGITPGGSNACGESLQNAGNIWLSSPSTSVV